MSQEKTDKCISRSTAALRQALLDLMSIKAFHAISVKEIVEMAGYNRGTFYAHYESKEMLLDDVFSKLIDELKQSFRAPYEEAEIFRIDELPANSVKIFEHFFRNSSVYTILFKSEVLPPFKEKIFASLMQIAAEDLDYTHDSINREFLLIYSMNALLGLVFHWIESGFHYSPDYMQDQLVRMINWKPTSTKINRR